MSDEKYILVVDDDPTMQMVLQGMIEKAGFKPVIAENGERALQFIEIGGANISVVLLDRHMPDMDGFEVVEKIKSLHSKHSIPVIMQSGSKTPEDIKSAIDAGIFYYLTKPFKIEALQNALHFAIDQAVLLSILDDRIEHGYTPFSLIKTASFEFRTREEARKMAILLSALFPGPYRVFPGLLSLLMNAVEHGKLGIGYQEKSAMIDRVSFQNEVDALEQKSENRDNIIEVQFIHKNDRFSVRITDKGAGFDWKAWVTFKDEHSSSTHGYGILKALGSFDEVKYNTSGSQVMASIFAK